MLPPWDVFIVWVVWHVYLAAKLLVHADEGVLLHALTLVAIVYPMELLILNAQLSFECINFVSQLPIFKLPRFGLSLLHGILSQFAPQDFIIFFISSFSDSYRLYIPLHLSHLFVLLIDIRLEPGYCGFLVGSILDNKRQSLVFLGQKRYLLFVVADFEL